MGGRDAVVEVGMANIHLPTGIGPGDAGSAFEFVLEDAEPQTERHCDYLHKRKKPTEVGCGNNFWKGTWLLLGLNHGMAGTLVEGWLIRQDNTQPLFDGPGGVFAGLPYKPGSLHGNLPSLIDENRDGFHGLRSHQDIQSDGTISQHRFLTGVTLLTGFQLGFLDGIGLLKLVQLLGQTPEAAEVVIEQVAG